MARGIADIVLTPRSRLAAWRQVLAGLLVALASATASGESADPWIRSGDAAWSERSVGHDGNGRAARAPIARAVSDFRAAVAAEPQRVDANWKLLRAMYFEAQYASGEGESQEAGFERALETAKISDARLDEDAIGTRTDLAHFHFFSALIWGAWGRTRGILAGVRSGVAGRLRRHGEAAVAFDDTIAWGGGHRLLSRLHASVPDVPFITGWVDRSRIFPEMQLAYAIAPDFPGNHLLMAITLLELAPERRDEAIALLQEVARLEPDPDMRVEQLAMREDARQRLEAAVGASIAPAP